MVAEEDKLSAARNSMKLGYVCPATGAFVEKSSVGLRTTMKTSSDEATRQVLPSAGFAAAPLFVLIPEAGWP